MISNISIDPSFELQTFDIELDGSTFRIDLVYNIRVNQWFISIAFRRETSTVPILSGAGLTAGLPILAGTQHPDRPLGDLLVQGSVDPGRMDLGGRCLLLYYDAAEINAAKAEA